MDRQETNDLQAADVMKDCNSRSDGVPITQDIQIFYRLMPEEVSVSVDCGARLRKRDWSVQGLFSVGTLWIWPCELHK